MPRDVRAANPLEGTEHLHVSDLQRSGMQDVREGDKLEFEIQRGQQCNLSGCNLKQA